MQERAHVGADSPRIPISHTTKQPTNEIFTMRIPRSFKQTVVEAATAALVWCTTGEGGSIERELLDVQPSDKPYVGLHAPDSDAA